MVLKNVRRVPSLLLRGSDIIKNPQNERQAKRSKSWKIITSDIPSSIRTRDLTIRPSSSNDIIPKFDFVILK